MNETVMWYIDEMLDYEETNHLMEAFLLSKKMLEIFPECKYEILIEKAKMEFRNGLEKEALEDFVSAYKIEKDSGLCDLILEAYYFPNEDSLREKFLMNCKALEGYSYFFGKLNLSKIRYFPIFIEENGIWYFDSREKKFGVLKRYMFKMREPQDSVYMAYNLLWLEDILLLERMTRKINPYMDMENPLLIFYEEVAWELLLQLLDIDEIIRFRRIVLYNDLRKLKESFFEQGIRFPDMAMNNLPENIKELLSEFNLEYRKRYNAYYAEAKMYYEDNGEKVLKHIGNEMPKVLFVTSRFTTALQYHVRDCKQEAERMGLETEILMEKDRLCTGRNGLLYIRKIVEFKPDIIFALDHFREERGYMSGLDNLVWVCWIQDTLPHIFSKETPLKQKERDVVISIFYNWKKFQDLGYNKERLLASPMVASHRIYHPYILSEEEKEQYGCDICLVCHASDADSYVRTFIEQFEGESKEYIEDLCRSYIEYVRSTDHIFIKFEELQSFIREFMKEFYGIGLKQEFVDYIAEDMRTELNTRLYRGMLADWLIEAGYRNIKLWGKEWGENAKYRPYAMGVAENGATLSKILQASKIVVGNNLVLSGASRVAETMLSGAFYLGNYIPPEYDTCDIRQWLKEGEDLIMFKSKEDFLHKVKFYLQNEEERQRMAKIGRERALEKLTYEKFMKNTIKEIGKMF